MRTANEQSLWEIQAYGAKKSEILESVMDSITFKMSGPGMVIASYLSDAQEVMQYGGQNGLNDSRQFINIAKMLLTEFKMVASK
jgi:hypothetical protein